MVEFICPNCQKLSRDSKITLIAHDGPIKCDYCQNVYVVSLEVRPTQHALDSAHAANASRWASLR